MSERVVIDTSAPKGWEAQETTDAKNLVMDAVQEALDHVFWMSGAEEPDDTRKLEGHDAISVADRVVEALIEAGWRPTEEA